MDTEIRKQFDALFGAMYLSESDTARRIFELGYKAGADQERKESAERKWVGLTDEEIAEGAKQSWVSKSAFESAVWWMEAKLKEKNSV